MRNYFPDLHNFEYIADIHWPGRVGEQLDWITGVVSVEQWLLDYAGPKYERWAWNMATECYNVSVCLLYTSDAADE